MDKLKTNIYYRLRTIALIKIYPNIIIDMDKLHTNTYYMLRTIAYKFTQIL